MQDLFGNQPEPKVRGSRTSPMISMNEYTVTIAFDDETQRWYAENDDIPIILEDDSLDVLMDRVKLATPEMLELNNMPYTDIHLVFKMEAQAVLA
jgi:hypothetical protein